MNLILAILAIIAAVGWILNARHIDKLRSCHSAYNEYIRLLEQDRNEWKKLAEDRMTEGDDWKDG